MALTAATWSLKRRMGSVEWAFQTSSLLSLPPEQSCCSSKDHFNPQTSCLCPTNLATKAEGARGSRCRMVLSRDPVEMMEEFHAMAPTRFECPCRTRTHFILTTSHSFTSPLLVPTENNGPFPAQLTAVAASEMPRSHSLVTLELAAFQRYTLEASPTARKFCVDQSMRLRQQSSWRAGASSTLHGSLLILRRFFVPKDTSSVHYRLLFCPVTSDCSVLSEYRSMLLFSKLPSAFSLPRPPSTTKRRQMSDTELLSSRTFSMGRSCSCCE